MLTPVLHEIISLTEKKTHKTKIINIRFDNMFSEIYKQELKLQILSYLLKSVVKIYKKKLEILLEEYNHYKSNAIAKKKSPKSNLNNFLLSVNDLYEMESSFFDKISNNFNDYFYMSQYENQLMSDMSNMSVEMMRNDNEIHNEVDFGNDSVFDSRIITNPSINISTRSNNQNERKRRRIVDSTIEYDSDIFNEKMKSKTVKRENNFLKQEAVLNNQFNIQLPNEIVNFFKINMKRESIEVPRNEVDVYESFVPDMQSFEEYNDKSLSHSTLEVIKEESEYNEEFKFDFMEDQFVFNDEIQNLNRREQANSFSALLQSITSGKILANQEAAYGTINCVKI